MRIDYVTSHTIGRSDIVFGAEVGKRSPEIIQQTLIPIGNRNTRRASFPNAHKPDPIETISSKGIPFA
jgi:hypothetical protein